MPGKDLSNTTNTAPEELDLKEESLPDSAELRLLKGSDTAPSRGASAGSGPLTEKELAQRCGLPLCSDKLAELLAGYFKGNLTRVERAELVASLSFPDSREGVTLFSRELLGLNSADDSSRLQLCARDFVAGPEATPEENKYALAQQRRHGLMALVTVENEMHRGGLIDHLSSAGDLCGLFAIKAAELRKTLRLLPPEEFRYRQSLMGREDDQMRFNNLIRAVRQEIASDRGGSQGEVRSDTALAQQFGLEPVVVFHYLREGLSPLESIWRDRALRHKLEEDPHRQSLLHFVRQELKAFDEGGRIHPLPDAALGMMFGMSAFKVRNHLQNEQSGLSADEMRFRDYVIKNHSARDPLTEALRQMRIIQLREKVARPLSGRHEVELHRGEIYYQGLSFCSFAEAACGLLLEKYLGNIGFKLEEGKTFQIRIDKYSIDFLVDSPQGKVFLEFHPIMMKRALPKARVAGFGTYDEYQKIKNALPESSRRDFARQVQEMLYREYTKRRQDVVDEDPKYSGTPLRTVTSERDLYYFLKFYFDAQLPGEGQFVKEFSDLRRHIIRSQKPQREGLKRAA